MNTKLKGRRLDLAQLGKAIVESAAELDKPAPDDPPAKNPAAVALGRLGGLKGGKARAKKLTAEQRTGIAKKAAKKMWSKYYEANPPAQRQGERPD